MGVVIRQSIFTSVISYAGVVIGYINLLYLYPRFLEIEQIGLLRTIQDAAILFVPFAQLGLAQSITRFFPQFNASRQQSSAFITLILVLSFVSFGLFWIIFRLAEPMILNFFQEQAPDLAAYLNLTLWLTFLLLITTLLETYSRSHLRVAFPGLLREVVIRLLQALLVTAYFVNLVDFREFLIANVVIYVFTLLALIGHLIYSGHFQLTVDFSFFQFQKLKALLQFSTLSFIGTSSMIIIGKVDSLMVAGLLGLASNAIYTTAFYMATVIEIPKRAILQTTMPLIAEAFEKNNLDEIKKIYQRVSINQLIIGSLLLIGVWANLHNIYALVPKGEVFQTGAVVVLLVGIAKLIDMVFGPSSEIIVLSRYYAFNIAVVLVLAVTVIGLNLLLIPRYGLAGAAGGSVAAMFLFNFTKYIFIYFTFGLQPFSRHTVLVLLIAGFTIGLNYALPVAANTILDIVYRSGLITLVFAALIYFSKSSTELNELALRTWKRIFGS